MIKKPNRRRRGVKASRIKLERFMAEAGIRSQAELAKRIADNEGLDSEPRALVSRVFRQVNVDYASLELIASVLKVEAYELYLSKKEIDTIEEAGIELPSGIKDKSNSAHQSLASDEHVSNQDTLKPKHFKSTTLRFAVLLAFFFTVLTVALFFDENQTTDTNAEEMQISESRPYSDVIFTQTDSLYPLAQYIVDRTPDGRMAIVPLALSDRFQFNIETLNEFEVDNIWSLEQQTVGRYISLYLQHYSGDTVSHYHLASLTENELNLSFNYIFDLVSDVIQTHRSNSSNQEMFINGHSLITKSDAQKILQARIVAEKFFDEESTNDALLSLESLAHQNAESLTVQCLIKTKIGWQSDEKKSFEEAKELCEEALNLDMRHPFVQTTNAYRLFRNGEYDLAKKEYDRIIQIAPTNVEAVIGQSQISASRYLADPGKNKQAIDEAISLALQAVLIDQDNWRSYHILVNFYFWINEPQRALSILERLIDVEQNIIFFANASLLSLCLAEFERASSFSQRMLSIDSTSYIAYETLFFLNAYQNDLKESLKMMEKAMQNFKQDGGGLFPQWGQLGDAHRRLNNDESAIEHYKRALLEYQQDFSKNQTGAESALYAIYLELAIHHINGTTFPSALLARFDEMDLSAMSASAQLKAAVIFRWLNNVDSAEVVMKRITETCPIYAYDPDMQ